MVLAAPKILRRRRCSSILTPYDPFCDSSIPIDNMTVHREADSAAIQNGPNYDDHYADVEKKEYTEDVPTNDPFGNEEEGEVKYRVMGWW